MYPEAFNFTFGTNSPVPTTSIAVVPFGANGVYAPYSVFAPITWGGVGTANSAGIGDNLLASQQVGIQQLAANSVGGLMNSGLYQGSMLGNLFNTWAGDIQTNTTTIANAFSTVANNSATACSGFFSCLF